MAMIFFSLFVKILFVKKLLKSLQVKVKETVGSTELILCQLGCDAGNKPVVGLILFSKK